MPSFSCLLPVIYVCDLFKTPMLLRFNNKKESSTYFGAFLSLGVLAAICVSFFQSDMIHKTNPSVIEKVISTYSLKTPDSPPITIDSRFPLVPFSFGLADYNRNIYKDPTIFSIDAYQTEQYGNNTIFMMEPLPKRPCQLEDTPLNFTAPGSIQNVFCVPLGNSFVIQGGSQDDIFKSIGFSLRVCNPLTDGVVCQSPEIIAEFLQDKYFFLYYADFTFNIDDYDNSINPEYSFQYTRVSLTSSTMMVQYYQPAIFQSDDNWIYSSSKETDVFNTDYVETNSITLGLGEFMGMNNYTQPLLMYYFGTTKTQHILTRRYQKLQEALANVAGISNTCIFIGFILTGFQSRLFMVTRVMKSLYISQHKQKKTKKKTIKKDEQIPNSSTKMIKPTSIDITIPQSPPKKYEETKLEESPIKKKDVIVELKQITDSQRDTSPNKMFTEREDERQMSKALSVNESQTLIQTQQKSTKCSKFLKYVNKNSKGRGMKITSYHYIKAQIKKTCGRTLTDEDKLTLKAEEIYNKETDILTLLTKLQDLEKLKKILLTEDQYCLFELIDKPRIYPDDENEITRNLTRNFSTLSSFSPKKKKEDIQNGGVQIYNKIIEKKEKSDLELRLLDLLERDIEEFDQNHKDE